MRCSEGFSNGNWQGNQQTAQSTQSNQTQDANRRVNINDQNISGGGSSSNGRGNNPNSNAIIAQMDEMERRGAIEAVSRIASSNASTTIKADFTLDIVIENAKMIALVDSGSDLSIIDERIMNTV